MTYELKYEKWPFDGYADDYNSWNLYENNILVAAMANEGKKYEVLIRDIKSNKKGMATKLLFMLLDMDIDVTTGIPDVNSTSEQGYYWKKSVIKKMDTSNGKYSYEIIGNSVSRSDDEKFVNIKDKTDNYHYKFKSFAK